MEKVTFPRPQRGVSDKSSKPSCLIPYPWEAHSFLSPLHLVFKAVLCLFATQVACKFKDKREIIKIDENLSEINQSPLKSTLGNPSFS